jgi:hypothetical protein
MLAETDVIPNHHVEEKITYRVGNKVTFSTNKDTMHGMCLGCRFWWNLLHWLVIYQSVAFFLIQTGYLLSGGGKNWHSIWDNFCRSDANFLVLYSNMITLVMLSSHFASNNNCSNVHGFPWLHLWGWWPFYFYIKKYPVYPYKNYCDLLVLLNSLRGDCMSVDAT